MNERIDDLEKRIKDMEEVLQGFKSALRLYPELSRGGDGSPDRTLSAMIETMEHFHPPMQ